MSKRTHTNANQVAVALAACAFRLPSVADGDLMELQVMPAGKFQPADGRKMDVPAWHIDQAIATRVIESFNQLKTPLVVDYEHQTLHKEKNGQPAPAAAWFKSLTWREGHGLFATVALTARARAEIDADEYLYFSPVFTYEKPSGNVRELRMGALTNTPGIHGMEPLTLVAAATFGLHNPPEDSPVNETLKQLLALLGLPDETTEAQALEAVKALQTKKPDDTDTAALCSVLGVGATATSAELVAACTSLKTRADATTGQYVPIAAFEQVKTQLAALTAQQQHEQVDGLVKGGMASGKLLPAQEAWARDLGKSNVAALTSYLDATAPIAALSRTQTGGQPPAGAASGQAQLSADEMAVCSAMGLTPEQFSAAKA